MLRGQEKGQDKGPEEGLFGGTTKIKLTHLKEIWKTDFPQNIYSWWKFTYQHQLFTEHENGPYGPYEYFVTGDLSDLWTTESICW